jgi:Protein of unknown function (DUF2975)
MPQSHSNALALSRRVLRVLITLNLLMGFLILALLIASLVAEEWVMGALGAPSTASNGPLILGMRLVMVIGVLAAPVTNVALTRLLAIVSTVSLGDPFVAGNATRLQQIAWAVLGLELLHLCVGIVETSVSSGAAPLDLDWNFSLTPWLAVLLLFVLARVFDHGTRMRAELEGTV